MDYTTISAFGISSVTRADRKPMLNDKSKTRIKRKMVHFLDISWIYAKPTLLK